jgi:phosphatidylglycerol:prolipoprotein diacylglycerol transferase
LRMNPVLFKIGSVNIYTHGLFLVLAVVAAGICLYLLAKHLRVATSPVLDLIIYPVLFGIIGARVVYAVVYYSYLSSPLEIFKIWEGGLVSWGGFILGLIAYIVVVKMYKLSIPLWLDMLAISGMLGVAVGRVGCFVSGELYGVPYTGLGAVRGIFPVTLAESLLALIVFFVLLIAFAKFHKSRGVKSSSGIIFLEGALLYSGGRFALDFLRSGEKFMRYFNSNQIVELIVFAVAIIAFARLAAGAEKGDPDAIE